MSKKSRKREQKEFKKSILGYIMTESEWEFATDDYQQLRKRRKIMDEILKMIGGIVFVIATLIYCLAAVFAPFGIVWLVLNH
tara:strand:- start:533 stop:778 length:246 start_codon:yes stop_codon:yes gene_type:complete